MSISVCFSDQEPIEASKGSAGLPTRLGGICTTVSALMQVDEKAGNTKLIRKDIG